ncbi:peptidylprolyl isomerase [Planctomycetaceae bacterium]|jgi:parvulin-like peptidyl-prolyl isomerase|nr:peptidylprolyl isomerase [bacterium]MDC0261644.1 peptidylprolyl isomerase [Planctomycetaceae bacterium]MDG2390550.1 peptidylprolyl isomerase [Planctomycetaceae bacterium]
MDVTVARPISWLVLALLFMTMTMSGVDADILAKVNNESITDSDLELEIRSRGQDPAALPETLKAKILEDLVERELIYRHLQSLKVPSVPIQIDKQLQLIKEKIEVSGEDPEMILKDLGFNDALLRKRLRYASMWQNYFDQLITEKEIEQYFDSNKEKFDGTEVRASQIFFKLSANPTAEQVADAKQKLSHYKTEIEAGKVTFADAAKKWSESPSGKNGGDLGFAQYRGTRTELYSKKLFPLKTGELTEPFQTKFGMHLMTVTDKRPGTFMFVDVRSIVLDRLRIKLWNSLVDEKRKSAKIQYTKLAPGR